jgi:hypothetical protein
MDLVIQWMFGEDSMKEGGVPEKMRVGRNQNSTTGSHWILRSRQGSGWTMQEN